MAFELSNSLESLLSACSVQPKLAPMTDRDATIAAAAAAAAASLGVSVQPSIVPSILPHGSAAYVASRARQLCRRQTHQVSAPGWGAPSAVSNVGFFFSKN